MQDLPYDEHFLYEILHREVADLEPNLRDQIALDWMQHILIAWWTGRLVFVRRMDRDEREPIYPDLPNIARLRCDPSAIVEDPLSFLQRMTDHSKERLLLAARELLERIFQQARASRCISCFDPKTGQVSRLTDARLGRYPTLAPAN